MSGCKRFKEDNTNGKINEPDESNCLIRTHGGKETESMSSKYHDKRRKGISRISTGNESLTSVSSTLNQTSISTSNQLSNTTYYGSSNNTSFDCQKENVTVTSLQNDKNIESPLGSIVDVSSNCSFIAPSSIRPISSIDESDDSNFIAPVSIIPISSIASKPTSEPNTSNKKSCSFKNQTPYKVQDVGQSLSTGYQSLSSIYNQPSTSNQPSNNTSFDWHKNNITSTNLQHDKNIDSSCSSTRDVSSDNSSIISQAHKSLCAFENGPNKDTSPMLTRNEFLSLGPNLVPHKNNSFDELPSQKVENPRAICDDQRYGDNPQSNAYADNNGDSNQIDAVSQESQPLQKDSSLRQFVLLDELANDQEEGEIIMESNSEESTDSTSDEEFPIEDIDEMLDEGLPEHLKSSNNKECPTKFRRKVVLEEIGHDHFDLLPEGWIQIMHACGMPVYLNQKSRVCTMARPYYLGPGSSRNHDIPLSAIPCFQYRRASKLEEQKKEEREKRKQSQNTQSQSEIELMSAEIETLEENKATQSLEASELHEYCKKLFKFKTLTLLPFKTWNARRKYIKMSRDMKKRQRPTLSKGTKLLKFPIRNPDGTISKAKGEWIINPNGKSYICILHEYVQHALKKHPKYKFKELENPATPYSATVFIEEMQYGFGMGASKKQAKIEAAKAALEVLIPGITDQIEPDSQSGMHSETIKRRHSPERDSDTSIFDQIKVDDPRVPEFCAKSTEPPPYAILLTCLSRNTGTSGIIELNYKMSSKSYQQDEYTMSIGNHKATVACRNKREGKQRAAQAILKALHPNVTYWGSLLRMYGNRSIKEIKEKKQEEQQITQLQSKASLNQPNYAILNKLKTELLKLKAKRDAVPTKGQFILPDNIALPSLSSTDLNKVNLSN